MENIINHFSTTLGSFLNQGFSKNFDPNEQQYAPKSLDDPGGRDNHGTIPRDIRTNLFSPQKETAARSLQT